MVEEKEIDNFQHDFCLPTCLERRNHRGKDTSDEDEEDILVTNSEPTSAIETLQRYLRQRQDCKSDISSMKIGEVKLFLKANKFKSYKQSTMNVSTGSFFEFPLCYIFLFYHF